MKKRVDSLVRIGKLAAQMHDLGRWRLSKIERERASLSDDLRAVFEALENGELVYGALAQLSAHRIRRLQKQLDALASESDRVRRAAHVHGMRAKLAERAAETADQVYRELQARKEVTDLIERALMRRDASQG
jgi:uncharacterized protein (DUF3084 family)